MNKRSKAIAASIGFRIRTGRAIAVVLGGPVKSPTVWKRAELVLSDPKKPDIWQPYHPVMDLPWEQAQEKVRGVAKGVRAKAAEGFGALVREVRAAGFELRGAGIVSGGSVDPEKIGNPHIRAHAAEGRLYREAVESGADACGVPRRWFSEKTLYEQAASAIGCSASVMKNRVAALGQKIVKPWAADEKLAALAAWVVLGAQPRE